MEIYIVLLIWLLFALSFRRSKIVYGLTFLFLLLLGGLRGINVGTDTKNYLMLYDMLHDDAGTSYVASIVEPFWFLLNKLVIYTADDYQWIIFIGVFLAIVPIFLRAWKNIHSPLVAILFYVLLYYYFNTYNIVRQSIALSIIFYSYPFWEKKQYKGAAFCTVLAMLFHTTAGVAFLIPFVSKLKLRFGLVLFALPISYLFGAVVMPNIIPQLPIVGKYATYIEVSSANMSVTRLLLNVFFVLLFVQGRGIVQNFYFKMFFVGIVAYNLLTFSPALGRCALYFMFSQLFVFGNLVHYKMNTIPVWCMILFYGVFYCLLLLNENNCGIVPYEFA